MLMTDPKAGISGSEGRMIPGEPSEAAPEAIASTVLLRQGPFFISGTTKTIKKETGWGPKETRTETPKTFTRFLYLLTFSTLKSRGSKKYPSSVITMVASKARIQ
jgi:hypothetical protein